MESGIDCRHPGIEACLVKWIALVGTTSDTRTLLPDGFFNRYIGQTEADFCVDIKAVDDSVPCLVVVGCESIVDVISARFRGQGGHRGAVGGGCLPKLVPGADVFLRHEAPKQTHTWEISDD